MRRKFCSIKKLYRHPCVSYPLHHHHKFQKDNKTNELTINYNNGFFFLDIYVKIVCYIIYPNDHNISLSVYKVKKIKNKKSKDSLL